MMSRPQARHLPLAPVVPQKTVSSLPRPIVSCAQRHGSLMGPVFLWLTAEASPDSTIRWQAICYGLRSERIKQYGCEPFYLPVSNPNPTVGRPSAKGFLDLKGHQVSHDVIARPRQFMGHRLTRDHHMALGLFPLVKSLHRRAEADGTLGRFHIGPLEIGVPILAVALAFPLAMTDFRTLDTATVRSVLAHRGKAANMARFQHDRLRQNRPDAIDRQELLVSGRVLQTLHDGLFQGVNLLAQTVQDRETAGDGQHLLGLGQHPLQFCLR